MSISGSCDWKACGSLCCKQFRLYYPKGTLVLPDKPKQKRYLYPLSEFINIGKMSGGDFLKLLAWRGITVETKPIEMNQMIYMVLSFPKEQKWDVYNMKDQGKDMDVIILPDSPCRYLRSNGTCQIHQRKPSICKDFPRGALEIPEGCSYLIKKVNIK